MQNGKVVSYASWQLNNYKQNYLTHEMELATIIHLQNLEY